jgi:hypothetical protein
MPKTGPTSAAGKRRSSLNSIQHAMNSERFLPCKRQQCFYWLGCPCRESDGHLPDYIAFGSPCPNEIAVYQELSEQYSRALLGNADVDNNDEIHLLVMSELKLMRARAALAIDPSPVRRIPNLVSGYDRPAPTLPFRYRYELTKIFYSQLSKLFPTIKEDI